MPLDSAVIGRSYPVTAPFEVTAERLRVFVESTGGVYDGAAPATFPIVAAFDAMMEFLVAERLDLSRIIHGEQRFTYERPVVVGDVLSVRLTVSTLRQIGGNDIVGTTSTVTDVDGALVCTGAATLVHRGEA